MPPKKTELDGGSEGVLKITILLFEFCTLFTSVEAVMCVSRSRNPFCKVLKIIYEILFSQKMLPNVILGCEGAFVDVRNLLQFWCFVNADWKINLTEGYSENLSTVAPVYLWSECSSLKCVGSKVHWPLCKPMLQFCVILTAKLIGVNCSNFQNVLLHGLSFILHNIKNWKGFACSHKSALVA